MWRESSPLVRPSAWTRSCSSAGWGDHIHPFLPPAYIHPCSRSSLQSRMGKVHRMRRLESPSSPPPPPSLPLGAARFRVWLLLLLSGCLHHSLPQLTSHLSASPSHLSLPLSLTHSFLSSLSFPPTSLLPLSSTRPFFFLPSITFFLCAKSCETFMFRSGFSRPFHANQSWSDVEV